MRKVELQQNIYLLIYKLTREPWGRWMVSGLWINIQEHKKHTKIMRRVCRWYYCDSRPKPTKQQQHGAGGMMRESRQKVVFITLTCLLVSPLPHVLESRERCAEERRRRRSRGCQMKNRRFHCVLNAPVTDVLIHLWLIFSIKMTENQENIQCKLYFIDTMLVLSHYQPTLS